MTICLTLNELRACSVDDTAPPIRTCGLCKTYDKGFALQDISLQVQPGELVGLLGPNGAGKTTTLKLLLGLLRPTSGLSTVFGLDCSRDATRVKQLLGYVPDEPAFYEYLTGRETLEFVAEMRGLPRKQSVDALGRVIADLGFETEMDTLVAGYSHGTKKKLAILAALVHRPRLLLLDEPTNGLDPPSAAMVRKVLMAVASEGGAVLVSTHLLDMADRMCGRTVVLEKGRMVFEGSPEALRRQVGLGGALEDAFLRLIGREEGSLS